LIRSSICSIIPSEKKQSNAKREKLRQTAVRQVTPSLSASLPPRLILHLAAGQATLSTHFLLYQPVSQSASEQKEAQACDSSAQEFLPCLPRLLISSPTALRRRRRHRRGSFLVLYLSQWKYQRARAGQAKGGSMVAYIKPPPLRHGQPSRGERTRCVRRELADPAELQNHPLADTENTRPAGRARGIGFQRERGRANFSRSSPRRCAASYLFVKLMNRTKPWLLPFVTLPSLEVEPRIGPVQDAPSWLRQRRPQRGR
jgi:hypothetical protein